MKRIIIIAIVLSLSLLHVAAQASTDVPQAVGHAFGTRYPNCQPHWEKTNAGFIASFKTDHLARRAYYTPGGDWIRTETHIRQMRGLPAAVRKGFHESAYVAWSVDSMFDQVGQDGHTYVIKVSRVVDDRVGALLQAYCLLYFSPQGTLTRAENVP
ncbi:MAG TPA: hypothetical protein VL547_06165 [Dinghuibacter sp.]|uniref:hypothetical protein n=1 Tax=Dinghuibacter sp. TaxID=2024697 RepID=UPI002B7AE54F|nr:hypothetical protein [Dinghuibacter sp.]HTJ11586.1 hypothetical protein [Dinghuibacter sp.]